MLNVEECSYRGEVLSGQLGRRYSSPAGGGGMAQGEALRHVPSHRSMSYIVGSSVDPFGFDDAMYVLVPT